MKLHDNLLFVPSLASPNPPTSLPTIKLISMKLTDESIAYPPLWKFWFAEFIPDGFWSRLVCRLTTDCSINKKLKSLFFPGLLESTGHQSSENDAFLPWILWKKGLALVCNQTLLLEVKKTVNEMCPSEDEEGVENCSFRIEAYVNVPGWITVANSSVKQGHAMPDIIRDATAIMVEIMKHISSLDTEWFTGMFAGKTIKGQVPCFVPCWKCCCKTIYSDNGQQPGPEQVIPSFTIMRNDDSIVCCWEYDIIIKSAFKKKTLWCNNHKSISIKQLAPELVCHLVDCNNTFSDSSLFCTACSKYMHAYYLAVIWWQVSIGYLDVFICFMPNLCLVNKALICKCQDTIKLKGSYFNNDSVVIN